jgi:hypothetical protein
MKLRHALTATSALLLVARLASANPPPTTADGWYDEGQTQYTLGNFDKAVDAFKSGFELETVESKKPAYLYNIAQAYRQAGDCKNSVFFYKRFLALKASDQTKPLSPERKAEVDGWVHDGEECLKKQDALRTKAPDGTMKPDDGKKPVVATVTPAPKKVAVVTRRDVDHHDDNGGELHGGVTSSQPSLISVRLLGGGTKVSAGDLKFPVEASGALIAGYPIPINDKLLVEAGVGFTFTPAPFDNSMSGGSETGKMFGVFANGGVRYEVAPNIGVRGDLGVGVLAFSGLDQGNPFTANGAGTTGALGMFHVRIGVSADYLITPNLSATLTPFAFGYSPAKSGLRDDIGSITSIDFLVGLGYRM